MTGPGAIHCRSYAKLNLYLEVLERRTDGYHNLETVFQSVSLYDEVAVTQRSDGGLTLACSREDLEHEGNLAYRAADLLRQDLGVSAGAHIEVTKRIPVAAGLAGGSGNAAAVLMALNDLWQLHLSREQLLSYGLELGSDVPFCLQGGTVAAAGRGEVMHPLNPLTNCAFVLVHPAVEVSTAAIFNHPKLQRQPHPAERYSAAFAEAIANLEQGRVVEALFNRMEPAVFGEHAALPEIKRRLVEAGCLGAVMSGSGPTLAGICRTRTEAAAIAARISDHVTSFAVPVSTGVEYV